jgi:RNA polymerase-interacting CarD/CdnL/TRCF family regulator
MKQESRMAKHLEQKRVVGGYSLKGINVAWLKRKAAEAMLAKGGSVSASEILDRLLDAAREKDGKASEKDLLEKMKKAGV